MPAGHPLPPELMKCLAELSRRLGPLPEPVHGWLAGGFAVHHHTQHQVSGHVGIRWSRGILIPPDLQAFRIGDPASPNGSRVVLMDGSFADVMGSFPPDWEGRSREVHRFGNLVLHVIDPVDLAVSKVARFSGRDREDIRMLAVCGLIDPDRFAARAEETLAECVGDLTFVHRNLADAMGIVASGAERCRGIGVAA